MTSIAFVERTACPLCQSDARAVHIAFPEIPVVRCSGCDFLYSSKTVSAGDLHAYYENGFGSQRHLQGQLVNARINLMAMQRLMDFASIGSVLDVGTGYGCLLAEMRKHHELATAGVELSRQEAEYAQRTLGQNVINSLLCDSGIAKGSFDLVTSFEVIEHIARPVEFLAELSEYAKPGGLLLVMTDNFESRAAKSLGAGFPKWIPHSHISHFSAATLRQAVQSLAHLSVVSSLSYTPWEILARDLYYKARGIERSPAAAFDLRRTLDSEMQGRYVFFALRKLINRTWARLTLSEQMEGALMYFLIRKAR